jgi:putative membrane protein
MRSLSPRGAAFLAVGLPALAWGHEESAPLRWTWDPPALAAIASLAIAYFVGVLRQPGVRPLEVTCFVSGLVTVVLALMSPLDGLSDLLFSAHMTQHELLMLVAAPLLVLARPWLPLLWLFGAERRERIGRWSRGRRIQAGWKVVTAPVLVLVVHGLVLWIWHLPGLFEAALADETVHGVQHAMFFVTAALFWWALYRGRYGRYGYGVGVAFVFVTALHTGLLGMLATVAREPWYPTYQRRAAEAGLTALEDQQLAGLVMWIPAGLLLGVIALALFAAWLGEAARRVSHGQTDAATRQPR